MLEFCEAKARKSRKEYVCDLCRDRIAAGKKYVRHSGKADGEMFDFKYHCGCDDIINNYCAAMGVSEYDEPEVRDWLQGEVCPRFCGEDQIEECFATYSGPYLCGILLPKMRTGELIDG